ncbi:MAG: pyridoxamine 5'-phosphate oxidase family protein [Vulcanimicrobiaceae bacterium]
MHGTPLGRVVLGELSAGNIDDVLLENVIGRIGCHAFGHTYVVPVTYVYHAGFVYGHGRLGMKIHMMRQNPRVCFEVDTMDDFGNWQSIIAWGVYEELHGEGADRALALLTEGVAARLEGPPGETVHPHNGMDASIVYRIVLEEKTGRYERRI